MSLMRCFRSFHALFFFFMTLFDIFVVFIHFVSFFIVFLANFSPFSECIQDRFLLQFSLIHVCCRILVLSPKYSFAPVALFAIACPAFDVA